MRDDDSSELWIQLGDERESHWSTFGSFLEEIFKDKLEDEAFIKSLLDDYKAKIK